MRGIFEIIYLFVFIYKKKPYIFIKISGLGINNRDKNIMYQLKVNMINDVKWYNMINNIVSSFVSENLNTIFIAMKFSPCLNTEHLL